MGVATGGLPSFDLLSHGQDLATSSWDILSGSVMPGRQVLVIDNNGSHSAMTIAEYLSERADTLEFVTSDRILAPEIGSTSYPGYLRVLHKAEATMTMNLRIDRLETRGNKIAAIFTDEFAGVERVKEADQVVVTLPVGVLQKHAVAFRPPPPAWNTPEGDWFIAGIQQVG